MSATIHVQHVADAGRWRALGLLALAVVLCMSPWFSAAAVLPQLRSLWGWSSAQGASLTLAVQLGFVAGALSSAVTGLPDRFAHRRLMLLGGLMAGAANLGLLAARPELVLPLRALTGAALALVYPVSLKAMSGWFVQGRGLALGVMVGALTLGSALPHLVNGLSGPGPGGTGPGGLDWRLVIACTSGLAALGGVLAFFVPGGPHHFPAVIFRPGDALKALAGRELRLTTLGYLGHMWELYACWAWFAAFFAGVLTRTGDPLSQRGAALATFAVVGVGALGCVAGGLLADRLGRARLTRAAMLLSGGCALALALLVSAPVWAVLAVSLLWGASIIADSAQFSALTSEVADPRYVGTALTVQLALGFTLTALSIALVPVVAAHWGWSAVFLLLAPGPLLGAWAMGRLGQE